MADRSAIEWTATVHADRHGDARVYMEPRHRLLEGEPGHCSKRCSALARYAAGWRPPQPSRDQRTAMGRAGGLQSGENRRRRAALRASEHFGKYITPAMRQAFPRWDLVRWKALLALVWNDGHKAGRSCGRISRRSGKAA